MLRTPKQAHYARATRTPEVVVSARPSTSIEPDTGIPDLIRRLTDDSKRLAADEVRLAKLELHESVRTGVGGAVSFAVALGMGVVALVALTILLAAVLGRVFGGNYWAGALVAGAFDVIIGLVLLRRGMAVLKEPSYSLEVSREALKDTAAWARHPTGR